MRGNTSPARPPLAANSSRYLLPVGIAIENESAIDPSILINKLAKDKDRNDWLASVIHKAWAKGRQGIIVGDRIEQLDVLRRKVIAMGPEYVIYHGQADRDNLRYRVLTRGAHCTGPNEGNSTRTSFAAWAKEKVK